MGEDEHVVRRVVIEMLRIGGFDAVTAADGNETLFALDAHPDIDLVITDVIMPSRGGLQVATDAAARIPGMPIRVISGTMRGDETREAIGDGRYAFLPQTFTPSALLAVVSELLPDGPATGASSRQAD